MRNNIITPLPKRILCPVDMSDQSAAALRYAGIIASRMDARLYVLHVHRWEPPLEFMSSQTDRIAREQKRSEAAAAKRMEEFSRKYVGDAAFETILVDKDVVEAVTEEAAKLRADLIVLGTHGRSGFERLLYGSVAEEIIRRSEAPVLAVRAQRKLPSPDGAAFSKIVCPVNFTDVAKEALQYACVLSEQVGASLVSVYAVEVGTTETEESVRSKLCAWVPEMTHRDCRCELVVRSGDAAEQVIDLAVREDADLVVIGAQKRPFLETTLFGTTTERVMRHAGVPVLVVPRSPEVEQE